MFPQGNRAAVMINATRRRVGGAIDVSGLNLPEGVTVTPIQMPSNRTTVPLLLSAAADAKLDARLVNFVGKIPDNPVVGKFTQRHQLLIGRNNSVVYDYWADRAAVAVIKAAPCKFQIVQPPGSHRSQWFDGARCQSRSGRLGRGHTYPHALQPSRDWLERKHQDSQGKR